MKTFVMYLIVSAICVVCSPAVPAYSNVHYPTALVSFSAILTTGWVGLGALHRAGAHTLSYSANTTTTLVMGATIGSQLHYNLAENRAKKLKRVIDENLPLPRSMVLRQLGLPLHDWLTADAQDFKDMLSLKIKNMPKYASKPYVAGDELFDPDLAKYLPSVYALAADDVLDSADVLDDFGNPTAIGGFSREKIFNFKDVVRIINDSLANTGRREIIANLNRLEVDAAAEFMRKFSLAWNLRVAQAGGEAEPHSSPLDNLLTDIIAKKQRKLEHDKGSRAKSPVFAPSAQEIAQQEEELTALQTLDAMPHSPERDIALAKLHTNYLIDSNQLFTFTNRDLAWLQRTKIGQAALQDISLSALAALKQVAELYRYANERGIAPADLKYKRQRREALLNLLDEHLQQALATPDPLPLKN